MPQKQSKLPHVIFFIICSALLLLYTVHFSNVSDSIQKTTTGNGLTTSNNIEDIMHALLVAYDHIRQKPFDIRMSASVRNNMVVTITALFILGVAIFGMRRNTMFGKEHGSSRWMTPKEKSAFADKDDRNNLYMSQNVRVSLFTKKRNLNTLIDGGSGSGKTFFNVFPNLMQLNCSYLITDPKGATAKALAWLMEKNGYEVIFFNLVDKAHSACYNFFEYLHKESDILKIAKTLIDATNTGVKQADGSMKFWDDSVIIWAGSIIAHIWMDLPKECHNMETFMSYLQRSSASEQDENIQSPVDIEFEALEAEKGSDYFPCKQYNLYKKAAGETAKSVLMSVATKFSSFNIHEVRQLTKTDTLHLDELGDRKIALFLITPETDSSLNFLPTLIQSQAFDELIFKADFGDVKFKAGEVYAHSRSSLMDKREKLESTFKQMQTAKTIKKKDRLYREIYQQMEAVRDEFGIKPYFPQNFTEKALNTSLDAVDDLLMRMNKKKAQLQQYYSDLKKIGKDINILSTAVRQTKDKSLKAKMQKEVQDLSEKRKALKSRIYYEYGIPDLYEKKRDGEERYINDIGLIIQEIRRSKNPFGSENTLRERSERIQLLEKKLKEKKNDLKDVQFSRKEKKLKESLKRSIAKIEKRIWVLETVSFYEFGIKKLSNRRNGGKLKVHVRFVLDEFANVPMPPEFEKIIAVIRSRNISAVVILQALSQIKNIYKDSWETIVANCDWFIFLGGSDMCTLEYVQKMLGFITIDKRSTGVSKGFHGNFSKNWDVIKRELMQADEIRRIPEDDCIVLTRGMFPAYDKKFNTKKHKRYKELCDDIENPDAPNFYPYREKFVTEEVEINKKRKREMKDNKRLLDKCTSRTIDRKEHAIDLSFVNSESLASMPVPERSEYNRMMMNMLMRKAADNQQNSKSTCFISTAELLAMDDEMKEAV